jgi:ABC-type amino acid transport substrate-binding protein
MNNSLREIISDGTYAEIYAKYTELPPGGDITKAD